MLRKVVADIFIYDIAEKGDTCKNQKLDLKWTFLNVRQKMKLKSVLKNCLDILITPITDIINISMETSTFPQNFKEAHVRPLLKKTSLPKNELKNYRPVSNSLLTSLLWPRLWHMITLRICAPLSSVGRWWWGCGGNSHWKSHHPILTHYIIKISTDMKLCLAPTIHNFKCVKITYIWLIWYQTFATIDV